MSRIATGILAAAMVAGLAETGQAIADTLPPPASQPVRTILSSHNLAPVRPPVARADVSDNPSKIRFSLVTTMRLSREAPRLRGPVWLGSTIAAAAPGLYGDGVAAASFEIHPWPAQLALDGFDADPEEPDRDRWFDATTLGEGTPAFDASLTALFGEPERGLGITFFREASDQSLASFLAMPAAVDGGPQGATVDAGVRLGGTAPLLDRWRLSPSLTLAQRSHDGDQDNWLLGLTAILTRTVALDGFDHFAVGPNIHYTALSDKRIAPGLQADGNGGRRSYFAAGMNANFVAHTLEDLVLQGSLGLGYHRSEITPVYALPQTDDGHLPDRHSLEGLGLGFVLEAAAPSRPGLSVKLGGTFFTEAEFQELVLFGHVRMPLGLAPKTALKTRPVPLPH